MRAHGGLVCVPELVGTAFQWPFDFARYSHVGSIAPFLAIRRVMTSSIGSRESATLNTSQLKNARASWPAFACGPATPVNCSLLLLLVLKSGVTSTWLFAAQASTCFFITSVQPGSQWSQKPMD